jgi:hypothetical protein
MYKIDGNDASVSEPARGAAGTLKYFSNALRTTVSDWWLNMVQNEICNAVTKFGLSLDKSNDNQLGLAIEAAVREGIVAHGNVVQHVKTDTQSITATATWTDVLTVTITPSSTSSRIKLESNVNCGQFDAGDEMYFRFVRDGTAIALGDVAAGTGQVTWAAISSSSEEMISCGMVYVDSPNKDTSVVYKVQARGVDSNDMFINRAGNESGAGPAYVGRAISTLIATELVG